MAQKITDYPMTFPYGATSAPYTPNHPHKGQDYGLTLQPVLVGNTVIGTSGNTGSYLGQSYPYHLHVQAGTDQWAQNTVSPVQYVGQPGTVVKTGWASEWGNYVCVQVNNIYVFYCHLSAINVTVGTVLHAEDNVAIIQNSDAWRGRLNKVMQRERGRDLGNGEFDPWVGQDFLHYVEAVQDNPESDSWYNIGQLGRTASRDNWQQQITDLQSRASDLTNEVTDLTNKLTADQATIASLQKVEAPEPVMQPITSPTDPAPVAEADAPKPTKTSLVVKLLAWVIAPKKKS